MVNDLRLKKIVTKITVNGLIFDMDGTIIDTKVATREAYKSIGVTMRHGQFGRPWTEWLKDSDVHDEKCRVYPEFLRKFGQELPLARIARLYEVPILTGASLRTVTAVESVVGELNVIETECGWEDKARNIRKFAPDMTHGIYVDDDERARNYIMENTTWVAVSPHWFLRQVPTLV